MPSRIIVQPNGRYARFSTVVDNFTHYDMTRAETLDLLLDDVGRRDAEEMVRRAEGNKERYEEAIRDIRNVHGTIAEDDARRLIH